MTNMIEFKKFKVLEYTTDFNKCDCCGREPLKGTVSIMDLDHEVIMHFGTGCAAAAEKYDTLEAAKKAKKEINNAVTAYKNSVKFAGRVARKIAVKKYGHTGYPNFTPLMPEKDYEALKAECIAWYTNPENKYKPFSKFN